MDSPIRVLLIEDAPEDAELLAHELRKGQLEVTIRRVDSEPLLREALHSFAPQVILSDYNMPEFSGPRALEIARAVVPDVPFIFVSGMIGEERAIEALRHGAVDYVLKDNRARLAPAVRRAMHDAAERGSRRLAEQQREASEQRFSSIAEATQEWIWEMALDGTNTFCNPAITRILGYAPDERVGSPTIELIDESDRHAALATIRMAVAEGRGWHDVVLRWKHKNGGIRFLESTALPLLDAAGNVTGFRGADRDITLRIQQHERIARLSRIHAVSSGINGMIVRVRDRSQLFSDACRIAVKQGGFRTAWIGTIDPVTRDGGPIAWAGNDAGYAEQAALTARPGLPHSDMPSCRALRSNTPVVCNDLSAEPSLRMLCANGNANGHRSMAALPLSAEGRVDSVIVLCAGERDFFDRREMDLLEELAADISFALDYLAKRERLDYVSYHDPLTSLANRDVFFQRLSQMIGEGPHDQHSLALVVVDLQRFRMINDTLGRGAGDQLLQGVADRLKAAFGNGPALARIGGDRFGVAISGLKGPRLAQVIENQIFSILAQPFTIAGSELRVTCKLGVAMFPDDARDAETLFRNAEAALQRAKETVDPYAFYSPEMNARVAEQLDLEGRLREAVAERQFVLAYQPKVELRSRRIVGLEALLRWQDPRRGQVSPLEFIPVLEETGLIVDVGRWVIEQAVADINRWRAQGLKVPRVAVNVSAVQVRQKDFVATVRAALGAHTGFGADVDLEITESLVLEDPDAGVTKLAELRRTGMRIYMDDFGTGYSNLGQMATLPLDALKIDRIFIARMTGNSAATAIVATIINLAKALRMRVVAEGVETEQQAATLLELGCDKAQGYLFARPMPAADITTLLGAPPECGKSPQSQIISAFPVGKRAALGKIER
jgi:diguanylate cyclase (GGDEF)-like protein/PAS domain S-box-containing protein